MPTTPTTLHLAPHRRRVIWTERGRYDGRNGRFEAVTERRARVDEPLRGRPLLAAATVECRHEPHNVLTCADCRHFLNVRPDEDRRGLALRCALFDDDPIHAVMTAAHHLLVVPSSTPAENVAALGVARGLHRVLVADGADLLGVAAATGLPVGTSAGAAAGAPLAVGPPTTPLAVAAEVLRDDPFGCVLVMDRDDVAGIVTRGDLLRAGVPSYLLRPTE